MCYLYSDLVSRPKDRSNLLIAILWCNTSRTANTAISITCRNYDHISSSNQDKDWTQVDWVKLGKAMADTYPQSWHGWLIYTPPPHNTHKPKKHMQLVCLATRTRTFLQTHAHTEIHTSRVVQPTTTVTEWDKQTAVISDRENINAEVWFGKYLTHVSGYIFMAYAHSRVGLSWKWKSVKPCLCPWQIILLFKPRVY